MYSILKTKLQENKNVLDTRSKKKQYFEEIKIS